MKYLFYLFLLIPFIGYGQVSESNNPITYDTTYSDGGGTWIIRITRQANNQPRPTIITMPGQGQLGSTDTANLTAYGFHYWQYNGYDGHVTISNGTHYPNYITVSYTNNVYPYPSQYQSMLSYLEHHYACIEWLNGRPLVGLTGFSQGSFTQGGVIDLDSATLGDQVGMKMIQCMAIFEGTPTAPGSDLFDKFYSTACSASWCDTTYYKTWATKYGGKYFYLEGSGSDNFRDGWHYTSAMNGVVPNSAYFSYETIGGGAHCCWNNMWDPSATNWTSVGTLGPNNGASQAGTNTMGNYVVGDNVYTWMYRNMGDTSIHGSANNPATANAGGNQSIGLPTTTATLNGSGTPSTGATTLTYAWTQTAGTTATIVSPTSAVTNITGLTTGTYTFKLTVTDNLGSTASSSATLTVASETCRIFYWDTTVTNINITNANLGASPGLHRCDIVYIRNGQTANGGYRSFSMSNIGTTGDVQPGMIRIVFTGGAHIAPSTANLFANTMDSCNWVEIDSFTMNNHVDMCFVNYGATGYSHHIYWHGGSNINGAGFLGNGGYTNTFTNWQLDSVNCFYDWHWDNFAFSQVNPTTTGGGLTALWIGSSAKNQVWMKVEIGPKVSFDNYSSASVPASYIHMQNCMYCLIHDDSLSNLAQVANAHPVGHAAVILLQADLTYIYNNWFGPNNFGNDVRNLGEGDTPPLDSWFSSWEHQYFTTSSTFDGTSRFYNNIIFDKRKYPVYETQNDPADTSFNPWYLARSCPWIVSNTAYALAIGVGNNYYSASMADMYSTDSCRVRNSIFTVLRDSTAAAWTLATSQGHVNFITLPIGPITYYDTASNRFIQYFTNSGLADSSAYHILQAGTLYNTGTTEPFYLPYDKNGQPRKDPSRSPGYDIGALQFVLPNQTQNCNCLYFVIPTMTPKQ